MAVNKEKLLEAVRTRLEQYTHNCGWTSTRYDDGYVRGMTDAIRIIESMAEEKEE